MFTRWIKSFRCYVCAEIKSRDDGCFVVPVWYTHFGDRKKIIICEDCASRIAYKVKKEKVESEEE